MGFIMDLDIDDFIRLIIKAANQCEEVRAWDMWLSRYPYMTKQTFVPFSEFFKQQQGPISKPRPAEELLAEAEAIQTAVKAMETGGE